MSNPVQIHFWACYYFYYQIKPDHVSSIGFAFGILTVTIYFLVIAAIGASLFFADTDVMFVDVLTFGKVDNSLIPVLLTCLALFCYQYFFLDMVKDREKYGNCGWLKDYSWLICIVPFVLSLILFIFAALLV